MSRIDKLEALSGFAKGWTILFNKYYNDNLKEVNNGFSLQTLMLVGFDINMATNRGGSPFLDLAYKERDSLILNGILDVVEFKTIDNSKEIYYFQRTFSPIENQSKKIAEDVYGLIGKRLEDIEISLGLINNKEIPF
jgi:hypothetical protein